MYTFMPTEKSGVTKISQINQNQTNFNVQANEKINFVTCHKYKQTKIKILKLEIQVFNWVCTLQPIIRYSKIMHTSSPK